MNRRAFLKSGAAALTLSSIVPAGLVARRRSEIDRRRVELALTDDGLRVLRSARSRRTAWLAARLKRLEPDELDAVEAALPALRKLLEDHA